MSGTVSVEDTRKQIDSYVVAVNELERNLPRLKEKVERISSEPEKCRQSHLSNEINNQVVANAQNLSNLLSKAQEEVTAFNNEKPYAGNKSGLLCAVANYQAAQFAFSALESSVLRFTAD